MCSFKCITLRISSSVVGAAWTGAGGTRDNDDVEDENEDNDEDDEEAKEEEEDEDGRGAPMSAALEHPVAAIKRRLRRSGCPKLETRPCTRSLTSIILRS